VEGGREREHEPGGDDAGRDGKRPPRCRTRHEKRMTGSSASAPPWSPTIARAVQVSVWCQPVSILPRRLPSSLVLTARPRVAESVSSARATRPAARATSHATGTTCV
jgi:hypothetical protein